MIILMKCLNEEYTAKRCISDFHDEPWVERIIVIDGGSTDNTIHILKKFTKVQTFIHPWLDWYHDMETLQSNIALSYIPHGKTAFILDFDERMSPELKEHLKRCNEIPLPESGTVISVARATFEVMRYPGSPHAIIDADGWPVIQNQIGQFPDYQQRMFVKNPHLHWINSPHHSMDGFSNQLTIPQEMQIIHYEKDDLRCRERIERKWLRARARRKELGLPEDLFETQVKLEIADSSEYDYWDWRH